MILLLAAAILFIAECEIFHYPFATGLDVLGLAALVIAPAIAVAWIFARLAGLKVRLPFPASDALVMLSAVLVFLGLYNLQQFHFTSDGGIVTRGLFGVDIPWLAGEVHGIRLFGDLRDLHQSAQLWQYHDATYRLLALFPRERTIVDLAFAAPLVGYTLLAVSVFTLTVRLTASRLVGWFTVAAWFLVSGWAGLDQSSYALSPSFVFGSVILVNVLVLFDLRAKHEGSTRTRFVLDIAIVLLLILLMETKLPSFLVLSGSLGLLSVIEWLKSRWRNGAEMFALAIIPLIVLLLHSHPNPYMPAGDFLVGAPLLGYANHLAALLQLPVNTVNPVTHGVLSWRSLLIIPYFAFHFARFVVTDPRILAAVILSIYAGRRLFSGTHLPTLTASLLVIMIPMGFLLPVLYSPAWYPLALSFYAPLVSTQAAILIAVPLAFVMLRGMDRPRRRIPAAAISMVLLAGFLANGWSILKQDRVSTNIIGADFIRAMKSIANTGDSAAVVTRRYDYEKPGDESYFWYAALSGHPVVSEGAKYGALLGAVADTDSAKGLHRVKAATGQLETIRKCVIGMVYDGNPCERGASPPRLLPGFVSLLYDFRAKYVVVDHTISERTDGPALKAMDTLFSNGACTVLKIPDFEWDSVAKTRKPAR